MDKYSILGELLYIISNYEKGKIKTDRIWGRHYINSLRNSIYIMNKIINLMKQNQPITGKDMYFLLDFIENNTDVILTNSADLKLTIKSDSNNLFKCLCTDGMSNDDLLELMSKILCECSNLLTSKPKNYKKRIAYLLMAFHNIPRAYLDTKNNALFNGGAIPLSKEDAKKYADYYMELYNRM